jgi:hypothetical protein
LLILKAILEDNKSNDLWKKVESVLTEKGISFNSNTEQNVFNLLRGAFATGAAKGTFSNVFFVLWSCVEQDGMYKHYVF